VQFATEDNLNSPPLGTTRVSNVYCRLGAIVVAIISEAGFIPMYSIKKVWEYRYGDFDATYTEV